MNFARGARLALGGVRRVLRMMANRKIITSLKTSPTTDTLERQGSGVKNPNNFVGRTKNEYDRMLRHGATTQSFAERPNVSRRLGETVAELGHA